MGYGDIIFSRLRKVTKEEKAEKYARHCGYLQFSADIKASINQYILSQVSRIPNFLMPTSVEVRA